MRREEVLLAWLGGESWRCVRGASERLLELRPVFRCCHGVCEMNVDGSRTGSRVGH